LQGDKKDNKLEGGGGADVLIGGDGKDALFGGAGADVLVSGRMRGDNPQGSSQLTETVAGGAGTDYIIVTSEKGAKIAITGGDADDRLLVHQSLLDTSVEADGAKIPLFALLGGFRAPQKTIVS
jgi:Ca2+-binding RTX toxin-like protein